MEKNIGFYISWQKNKCSIYVGGSFASERNIPQKVEAVGITCNIVQLKDRITLTAKEQRYLIGVPKLNSLMCMISMKKNERKKRSILCDTKWKEAGMLEKAALFRPHKEKTRKKKVTNSFMGSVDEVVYD